MYVYILYALRPYFLYSTVLVYKPTGIFKIVPRYPSGVLTPPGWRGDYAVSVGYCRKVGNLLPIFLAYAILVLVALYLSLSLPARRGRPGMAHAPALTEAILEYGV